MIVDPGNGAAWPVLRGQPYPVAFSDLREAELQPLTKKFEGHGSGEVEVKTGKMLGNSLLPGIKNLEIFGSL